MGVQPAKTLAQKRENQANKEQREESEQACACGTKACVR